MARSQLLKDAVGGKETIENLLLRLKVILTDLDNENIINWIDGELEGYNADKMIPQYRILQGNIVGTFVVNHFTKYTNHPVPLHFLISEEKIDELSSVEVDDGIAAIQNILSGENRENYACVIPTEYCHAISKSNLQVAEMRVTLSSNHLDGIVSSAKKKLVEVIMELEKEFENLDELDIRSQIEESDSSTSHIVNIIENIIYDDSIKMGDKNKIKKSKFGHLLGRVKGEYKNRG